jgi:hypothetical protein
VAAVSDPMALVPAPVAGAAGRSVTELGDEPKKGTEDRACTWTGQSSCLPDVQGQWCDSGREASLPELSGNREALMAKTGATCEVCNGTGTEPVYSQKTGELVGYQMCRYCQGKGTQ